MGLYNRGRRWHINEAIIKLRIAWTYKREGGLYTGWVLYTGFYGICIVENRHLWSPLQSAIPRK